MLRQPTAALFDGTPASKGASDHRSAIALVMYMIWVVVLPKAGFKLGADYPVTASVVVGALVAIMGLGRLYSARLVLGARAHRRLVALWLISLGLALVSGLEHGLAPTLAKALPVLLPAMSVPWLVSNMRRLHEPTDLFLAAAYIPLTYGALQVLFGRAAVAVPGLTVNLSDWRELGPAVFESKNNTTEVGVKLASTFQNGNLYGVLLVAVFGIVLSRVVRRSATFSDRTLLLLSATSIVLTLSRTCLIASVVTAMVVLIASRGTRALIIGAAMVGLGVIVASTTIGGRLFDVDVTGAGRAALYEKYFSEVAALDPPQLWRFLLIGFGPGADPTAEATVAVRLVADSVPFVENFALNLMLMGGFVLCVAYVLPLFSMLRRAFDRGGQSASPTLIGLAAGLIGILVYFSLDQSLNLPPSGALLWLMFSLLSVSIFARGGQMSEQFRDGRSR